MPDKAWRPANNGAGKRIWFVMREDGSDYHYAASGYLIRYKSYKTAQAAANRLNKKESAHA